MLKFNVGDNVIILGEHYFQSANGTLYGGKINKQILPIKKIAPLGAHPYKLETIDGWFDERDLKLYKEIKVKVGDNVRLIKNETYAHKPIRNSNESVYVIQDINVDVATIQRGKINFKVNVYNLKKVN